jgi:heme oxygenase (biliverdin-IX-beta and delta-forming)
MVLLDTLRSATAMAHRRLERKLPLMNPGLSLSHYRDILAAMWGYHAPLEAQLGAARAWDVLGLDATAHQRTHRLRDDLRALGLMDAAIDRLPRCDHLPSITPASRALGCLYVIEGSTLGGQVLLRHLTRHLAVDACRGGAFFAGHGEATAARWRQTCAGIAAFGARATASEAQAAEAAVHTFTTLEAWLDDRGVLA